MSSECVAGGSIIPVTGAKRERQRVHRTILTICYAGALRVSEAIRLTVADIDSSE
jgi:integrase